MPQRLLLGPALLDGTSLSEDELAVALARQETSGERLTDILLDMELVPEADLLRVLAQLYAIPVRDSLSADEVDIGVAMTLPIGYAKHHHLLPFRLEDGALDVAIADPLLTEPLDDLRIMFPGTECRPVLVTRRQITACINHVFDRGDSADELAEGFTDEDLGNLAETISHEPEDLLDASDEGAPVVRLVNSLLQQAVKEGASDIHVEPMERELVVRFRTDDILYEPIRPLAKRLQHAVTSRIKIMGKLDIAEKRLPQDGRITLKIAGREYDVRLSTIPTQYGERCVLRLLPRTQDFLRIDKIGLSTRHQQILRRLIRRSSGIILVTGPTGSGKTSTLYAALAEINGPDKNIITLEEPPEIKLDGIGQIEVRSDIGLSFAHGLRHILRQDPNVILVGEIRDLETAEIAIQASLTGHLVFSTIHTIDSAGALTRLIDMGVEPFLIGSSLVASVAQRLVRKLCLQCREAYQPTADELREVALADGDVAGKTIYRARGCGRCGQKGYRGRTAIFEILIIDDDLRPLITRGVDSKTIAKRACQAGMTTMRMDGATKVLSGETSIAEVLRQTEEEAVSALNPEVA